jgi:hypothetical protein
LSTRFEPKFPQTATSNPINLLLLEGRVPIGDVFERGQVGADAALTARHRVDVFPISESLFQIIDTKHATSSRCEG